MDPVLGHAAGPDHAAVAEVERLRPGEDAAQAQPALVLLPAVPAVVRHHCNNTGGKYMMMAKSPRSI